VSVRLSGVTDPEQIAAVLGRNSVRHGVTFGWSSSQADAVREELAAEAAAAAVGKAKKFAELTGTKAGGVLDLTTSQNVAASTGSQSQYVPRDTITSGSSVVIFPSLTEELIEDEKGLGILIRVSASVTLQAKPE
jgi:Protein of unknown function (DUF541)